MARTNERRVPAPGLSSLALSLWLSASLVAPGALSAAPELSEAQIQRLETLSGLGREACEQRDWESCHRMFTQAQELLPWAPHEFYIAEALVGMGRLLEGARIWQRIIEQNPAPSDPIVDESTAAARARLTELGERIPRLELDIAPEHRGLVEVRLDGTLLAPEAHARSHQLDPGAHVVELAQAGFTRERHSIELREREHKTLTVELTPVAPSDTSPRDDARSEADAPSASPSSWRPVTGYTLVTLGALSTIAGAVTYALKEQRNEELERACGGITMGRCMGLSLDQYDARVERIEDRTLVSNVLLFGGGGLLLGGAALLVWDAVDADETGRETSTEFSGSLSDEAAWLGVKRRF